MTGTADRRSKRICQLGFNELYQSAMHGNDFYRGNLVSCRYGIPAELQPPSPRERLTQIVDTAIVETASKHPLLQVGILNVDSKKPTWISLQAIDMQQHIEWRNPESLKDLEDSHSPLIESQLDIRFQNLDSVAGWRAVVLCPADSDVLEIIFAYNHANGDGTSGKIFHQDLLESLKTITTEASQTNWEIPVAVPPQPISKLPPPTERLVKLKLSAPFVLGGVWKEYRPSMFNKVRTLADWAPIRTTPYKTNVRAFSIDSGTLTKISGACRREKTTVTGLFHGLALVAFASYLEAAVAPAFESGTAVCMRRFLPSPHPDLPQLTPDRTIANYVTALTHEFDEDLVARVRSEAGAWGTGEADGLSPTLTILIWDVARTIRGDIIRRIDRGVKDDLAGLMKFVPDWKAYLQDKAAKPRHYSWSITNIGIMDNGKAESSTAAAWSLHRAQLGVSSEVPGPAMFIAPMSVVGEQMRVSCTWQDCAMDYRMAEHISLTLERLLAQIVSRPKSSHEK